MSNEGVNGVPMSDVARRTVEHMLGRKVLDVEQGQTKIFSDFTGSDLEELSALANAWGGMVPCIAYVRFRLAGRTELNTASLFVDSVLRQGTAIEVWLATNTNG